MVYLRHREQWTYDVETRTVVARFANGIFHLPVCTERKPRNGSYYVSRRSADVWQISTTVCVSGVPVPSRDPNRQFLQLTGAPEAVSDLLAELYE